MAMHLPTVSKETLIRAGLRGFKVTPALAEVLRGQPRDFVSGFLRAAPRLLARVPVRRATRIVRRRRSARLA